MAYTLRLQLPGDPAYVRLASRVVQEVGTFPEGPGGKEAERLAGPLEEILATLLKSLQDEAKGRTLILNVEASEICLSLELRVEPLPNGGSSPLQGDPDPLEGVRAAFDDVDVQSANGSGLSLSLVRHIPC